jgi:hypothetical protein
VVEIDGDHGALLTAPQRLAWALLEAVSGEADTGWPYRQESGDPAVQRGASM